MATMAQSPQNRIPKTIVADVLAQMPAKTQEIFNRQMADLAGSGSEGIALLTGMMSPTDNNTAVSYAIGGLCYWCTAPGRETERATVNAALVSALEKATDRDIKAFYLRMLAITGDDSTIPAVAKYATDAAFKPSLSPDAVSTLIEIGTPKAKQAIKGLVSTIPDRKVAVKAMGDLAMTDQNPLLIEWLTQAPKSTEGEALRKSIYYALSETGGPSAIPVLYKAAKAEGFIYEPTSATASYLNLLDRIGAVVPAQKLLKSKDEAIRSAAIAIVGRNNVVVLSHALKAMGDPSRNVRNAALVAATPHADEAFTVELLDLLRKPKYSAARVDIVTWLGKQNKTEATRVIAQYLSSDDNELRLAATHALVRLGTPEALEALSQSFLAESSAVGEVKEALLWYKGPITATLMSNFDKASQSGKIAIIELVAARRDATTAPALLALTDQDNAIGEAAYTALESVATPAILDQLCSKLDKATKVNQITALQRAIGTAVSTMPADKALSVITAKMKGREALYYPTLAWVGTPAALSIATQGTSSSDATARTAAVATILQWPTPDAAEAIYNIFVNPELKAQQDVALAGYIKLIGAKGYNDTQKFIYLRKAIEKASTPAQKNLLLAEIARLNSFNALLLAGSYLGDAATEQAAGTALMNIAVRDKTYAYYGPEVKALLTQFLAIRKGGDAPYDKAAIEKYLAEAPDATTGFVSIFNGKDLNGWKGLVANPIARGKMTPAQLAAAQVKADEVMLTGWEIKDGVLYFTGHGDNLCTDKKYGDFEMYIDWMIEPAGDAGIYLRGAPQVQIWDTSRREVGAEVGSGGLYNNSRNPSKPTALADNAIGEWNTFYIKMVGERVTVHLNGIPVAENVILENYWDRSIPIFNEEQLELQAHGTLVGYRDIYVKELPKVEPYQLSSTEKAEGFKVLFDGVSMNQWIGNTKDYVTENGTIALYPGNGGGGNLYSKDEYADFNLRFDFMLTEGANNGLGIRTPLEGDAAYVGIELQILDSESPIYKDLEIYQYHGSAYGILPAKRGFLKPVGEWNHQEVIVKGSTVKVILNGTVILDGDLAEASKNGTADRQDHPGLKNKTGHIAFLGHGSEVKFKDIRIKELK